MSVRFFVTSAAFLIFSWLTVTFLTVVPMETYPAGPEDTASLSASGPGATMALTDPEGAGLRLISTRE